MADSPRWRHGGVAREHVAECVQAVRRDPVRLVQAAREA